MIGVRRLPVSWRGDRIRMGVLIYSNINILRKIDDFISGHGLDKNVPTDGKENRRGQLVLGPLLRLATIILGEEKGDMQARARQ